MLDITQNDLRHVLELGERPVNTLISTPIRLVHCVSLPIKLGREGVVRAWWRNWAAKKTDATQLAQAEIVAQSVFLDERNGRSCLLLYTRLQRLAESSSHIDAYTEQQRSFAETFVMADSHVYELLFDVDRIAKLTSDEIQRAKQAVIGAHDLPITGQTQCLRIRIQPYKLGRVRDYCGALPMRDGLFDVLRGAGVLIETMFLDRADDADYVLFYSRVENLKASGEVFKRSRHPVDEEARDFMAETWALPVGVSRLELLYDVDRIAAHGGSDTSHQPPEG